MDINFLKDRRQTSAQNHADGRVRGTYNFWTDQNRENRLHLGIKDGRVSSISINDIGEILLKS